MISENNNDEKFFLLILLLLPALFFSAEAETLVLPPGTPVQFRDVNLKRPPVLITEKKPYAKFTAGRFTVTKSRRS